MDSYTIKQYTFFKQSFAGKNNFRKHITFLFFSFFLSLIFFFFFLAEGLGRPSPGCATGSSSVVGAGPPGCATGSSFVVGAGPLAAPLDRRSSVGRRRCRRRRRRSYPLLSSDWRSTLPAPSSPTCGRPSARPGRAPITKTTTSGPGHFRRGSAVKPTPTIKVTVATSRTGRRRRHH